MEILIMAALMIGLFSVFRLYSQWIHKDRNIKRSFLLYAGLVTAILIFYWVVQYMIN